MRSLLQNKRLILAIAVLALLALTVLAVSLDQVPFREAERFGRPGSKGIRLSVGQIAQVWTEVPILEQLFVWILAGLLIILIGVLVSPELRKRMLIIFIRVAFWFWAIYFLLTNYGDRLFGFNPQELANLQQGNDPTAPVPVFEPPQVSETVSYLISFALALFWLAVIWGLYRGWKKYLQPTTKRPLEEIARIARSSLKELASGRNSSDVIIRCYLRMNDVVSDRRQLHRAIATTPREFAVRLEQAGLPGEAVSRLTLLFEAVRYGDRKSGPKDVNEAVSCLETILSYCGEPV